jgi:tRNA-U20-dihydrouridine synthase
MKNCHSREGGNPHIGSSILAPMAGITGYPFRKMALKYGAEFCFTEMISADGFLHNDRGTLELLKSRKRHR